MRSATKLKTGRDKAYLNYIRTRTCVCCVISFLRLPSIEQLGVLRVPQRCVTEAAHTGPHGMSQKSPDRSAIPLCGEHHREGKKSYHKLGPVKFFKYWRFTAEDLIADLQEEYTKEQS